MPIKKFRSIEEMDEPHVHQPGTPALAWAVAAIWDFGRRVAPRRFAPGVQRFRSIEAMSQAQDAAQLAFRSPSSAR